MVRVLEKLEGATFVTQEEATVSIAISLKRIADALDDMISVGPSDSSAAINAAMFTNRGVPVADVIDSGLVTIAHLLRKGS